MEYFQLIRNIDEVFTLFGNDLTKTYLWTYFLSAGIVFAVFYVLQSIGLYVIAKRGGYKNRWMAFVPFFNTYYMGVLAEKNKIHRVAPQALSLAAAIIQAIVFALSLLYYIAVWQVFSGGYVSIVEVPSAYYGFVQLQYEPSNLPENLEWAWWIFQNLQDYFIQWLELAYVVLIVFVLISFYRTYACRRYALFSILSILFPIQGAFIFAIRNNRGMSYAEYVREQQQRQYREYQDYLRSNPPPYGNGGQYGGQQSGAPTRPQDPFDGLGANDESDGDRGGDPFGDL